MKKKYGETAMKAIIFILAVVFAVLPAFARTLIVAADGSGEFVHIGDAADSAQFGDTVLVRDGLYEGGDASVGETIRVDSGVVVMAEHPGRVAVTVFWSGIELHGSAKLMGFSLAPMALTHMAYIVTIEGGPAVVYNCAFYSNPPNSIGEQVAIHAQGYPPVIQACHFQLHAPLGFISNADSTTIWIPGNYFDTTDTTVIHIRIYDGFRDSTLGCVYVSPVLDSFEWLGVDDRPSVAVSGFSSLAYPNPFNSYATISFTVPWTMEASLRVYNLLGQEIVTLMRGNIQAGTHIVPFDGRQLASGVYIYSLEANGFAEQQKMVVVK